MLTLLITADLKPEWEELRLDKHIADNSVETAVWHLDETHPLVGVNAVATSPHSLEEVLSRRSGAWHPRVVCLVRNPSDSQCRRLILAGAHAVLDLDQLHSDSVLWVVGAAALGFGLVPRGRLHTLVSQLDERPTHLSDEDFEMLRALTRMTIVDAGRKLGYSRRQIQRRYKEMCTRLGFKSHLEAAITATRWGLDGPEVHVDQGEP